MSPPGSRDAWRIVFASARCPFGAQPHRSAWARNDVALGPRARFARARRPVSSGRQASSHGREFSSRVTGSQNGFFARLIQWISGVIHWISVLKIAILRAPLVESNHDSTNVTAAIPLTRSGDSPCPLYFLGRARCSEAGRVTASGGGSISGVPVAIPAHETLLQEARCLLRSGRTRESLMRVCGYLRPSFLRDGSRFRTPRAAWASTSSRRAF